MLQLRPFCWLTLDYEAKDFLCLPVTLLLEEEAEEGDGMKEEDRIIDPEKSSIRSPVEDDAERRDDRDKGRRRKAARKGVTLPETLPPQRMLSSILVLRIFLLVLQNFHLSGFVYVSLLSFIK